MKKDCTALVADDDPIARGLAAQQLWALGAKTVLTVNSGKSALRELQSEPSIDLLITDLRMPDMDGIELLRQLGQHSQRLGVILMSSLGNRILRTAEQVARGRNLDVLGVAAKPLNRKLLESLLDRPSALARDADAPHAAHKDASVPSTIDPKWIREALANNQYQIAVQPEVDARTMALHSVEVLSRWTHPELQKFSPFKIIGAAEEHDLIDEITLEAVNDIGKARHEWARQKLFPKIALNVSGLTLNHLSFPERLYEALYQHGIGPDSVMVEFTETALPTSASDSLDVTSRLMLKGFSLSIDDYGTGYSNLERLQSVPLSQLKIDRAFISTMLHSADALKIVRSSVELAHSMDLHTVAEGVENEDILALCRRVGCDLLQGYHIARPMEPELLDDWHKAWRRRNG